MAGGKKKSAANKLAKMSDEERARYLQHKADMEEEAKRRKEQLIATFMKKKIKKEDAFARLNMAKINQNWHQILRKIKCQEMKENVEHLRAWIERVITYKNRTISKLMEELEEAEEQYSNNFQYHATHIDNIIENQHDYMEKLQKEYDDDMFELMEATKAENDLISKNALEDKEHLMTVFYEQETEGKKLLREEYESYMTRVYATEHDFQFKIKKMRSSREAVSSGLWRQIATVVGLYVQQTDSRRMHLAELQRLDAESAVEIAEHAERIRREEEQIESLQSDYETALFKRKVRIQNLESELENLSNSFLKAKKGLQRDLQTDEKKVYLLSGCAFNSVEYLKKLAKRGEHMKNLASTCKKFETEREKISRWLPLLNKVTRYDGEVLDIKDASKIISEELKDIGKLEVTEQDSVLPMLKILEDKDPWKSSRRPKTAMPKSAQTVSTTTPESKRITAIKDITIRAKSYQESSSSSSQSESSISREKPRSILDRCFDSLQNMENFWFVFNKVELDYMEIKEERKVLEDENKQLRGMIRAVLEAAVLYQKVSKGNKVSTRMPSRRGAYSAPQRRVLFG